MITSILIFFQVLLHPFHVSVSEIKYKPEQKSLQISTRIFLDDLELAMRAYTGYDKLDITEPENREKVDASLKKYTLEHVRLWDDKGKPYQVNYVGAEIDEDVMWCYLEIEKVKKLKSVKVKNSLLHEVWGDQENLVHFRAFEKVKSARLFKGEDTKVFKWE